MGGILPASPHPQFKQLSAEGLPQVNVIPGERRAGAPQKVSSQPRPFAASATALNPADGAAWDPHCYVSSWGLGCCCCETCPSTPLSVLCVWDTTTPHPLWTGAAAALCALPLEFPVTALIQHHWAVLLQLLLFGPLCASDVMALTCHHWAVLLQLFVLFPGS